MAELRTWDDGKRCGECCNGDRCDDPTHVDRSRCSHCKSTGWALWTEAGRRDYAAYLLGGNTNEKRAAILSAVDGVVACVAPQGWRWVPVDANNYSRILTLLGMEEEGDPVAEVELLKLAAAMNRATPGSTQECADLRNVIQAACTEGGLSAMAAAWAKYFPDHPISIAGVPPMPATHPEATYSGWLWTHNVRGGEYRMVGTATLQTDKPLLDMAEVVVYRAADGRLWVRAADEWDERFKRMRPDPACAAGVVEVPKND